MKLILDEKGVEAQFPKDVLKEAFSGGLIDDEQTWLSMLRDRNLTSHTYDEALADEIYSHIVKNVVLLRQTFDRLA